MLNPALACSAFNLVELTNRSYLHLYDIHMLCYIIQLMIIPGHRHANSVDLFFACPKQNRWQCRGTNIFRFISDNSVMTIMIHCYWLRKGTYYFMLLLCTVFIHNHTILVLGCLTLSWTRQRTWLKKKKLPHHKQFDISEICGTCYHRRNENEIYFSSTHMNWSLHKVLHTREMPMKMTYKESVK